MGMCTEYGCAKQAVVEGRCGVHGFPVSAARANGAKVGTKVAPPAAVVGRAHEHEPSPEVVAAAARLQPPERATALPAAATFDTIEWEAPPPRYTTATRMAFIDSFVLALRQRPGEWAVYRRDAKSNSGFRRPGVERTSRINPGAGTYTIYVRWIGKA